MIDHNTLILYEIYFYFRDYADPFVLNSTEIVQLI